MGLKVYASPENLQQVFSLAKKATHCAGIKKGPVFVRGLLSIKTI